MSSGPPHRVLIIEDDLPFAEDLASRLDSLGFQVAGQAANGPDAVALADRENPDLILANTQLSGTLDGLKAVEEIRQRHAIPVLFLSALDDAETIRRAMAVDPDGYVLKPLREGDLRAALALAKRRTEKRTAGVPELRQPVRARSFGWWEWDLTTSQVRSSPLGTPWAESAAGAGPWTWEEWQNQLHPEDRDRAVQALRDALGQPGPDYQVEFRWRQPAGTYRWILAQGSLELDELGWPQRLRGTQVDITSYKERESEIERMNRLYLTLSQVNQLITRIHTREELLEGICQILVQHGAMSMAWVGLVDEPTHRVVPAARFGGAQGYLDEIQIYADDRPEGRGSTGTAIREGRIMVCDDFAQATATKPWHRAGARWGFGSSAAFPIREAGRVCGALTVYAAQPGFFRDKELLLFEEAAADVSFALDHLAQEAAKRRAEAALRQSEATFHGVIDASPVPLALNDAAGNITYLNPAFTRVFGYDLEDIPTLEEWWPRAYPEVACRERVAREWQDRLARTRRENTPFEPYEVEIRCQDNSSRTVLAQAAPLSAASPTLDGLHLVVLYDITERKQLEAQLRQSQKLEAIGQLAGGVAHDFNNILTAVIMNLGLLGKDPSLGPETRETVAELETEIERAAGLTRQLLLFSRRSGIEVKLLNLNEVVANLVKMLGRLIGENIALRFAPQADLPPLEADAGMLEQVLVNLAVNARDAMPEGGQLCINTARVDLAPDDVPPHPGARPGSFVCLAVADTGCGMEEATLKRIFEPFFTTKEAGQGTGLGLATAHGIVSQHKGWIDVASTLGRGSTFRVFLPAARRQAPVRPGAVERPADRGGRETILVVEDTASVRRILVQTLRLAGYRVWDAANGLEALQQWQEHEAQIDLLFTDMVMPEGLNGLELARRMRQGKPALKVIISTGYRLKTAGLPAASEKVLFLSKPYPVGTMLEKVRECLDQK